MDRSSKEIIDRAFMVYSSLQDEESKEIYRSRLLMSVTKNYSYMKNVYSSFSNRIERINRNKEFIIYGAGEKCKDALYEARRHEINISFICDKDTRKQNDGYENITVISPEQLVSEHKNACIIVSTTRYEREVVNYLKKYFPHEAIILLLGIEMDLDLNEQYFDEEIIKLQDGEIFIDAGCYNFETSLSLLDRCEVSKIYAFEPDKCNMKKTKEVVALNGCEIVELHNKGLWNKTDVLAFSAEGDIGSCISSNGNEKIEVVALDDIISEKVTFIKMDIEGAELNALIGAEKLISKYKPKLAICVYHKEEDIIDIPAYILSLVPEYKIFLRHYSHTRSETVLYAVV